MDESSLTGEPLPVVHERGGLVRSGTANAGETFELRAIRPAAESAYAAVVALVRDAESRKAPFVRLADRYAIIFLPLTVVIAGLAWALSGDPVRALAVFVVATPCPLILAAPIAFDCGDLPGGEGGRDRQGRRRDRAARPGADGAPRQDRHRSRSARPRSSRCSSTNGIGPDELVRLAASLDQLSAHPLAEALVHEATGRGFELSFPEQVTEEPGRGIAGVVDGRRVAVGSETWLRARARARRAVATRRRLSRAARRSPSPSTGVAQERS